jgi:signal peptidase I
MAEDTQSAGGGAQPRRWHVPPRDSVKDTIDSVVIAFILAFTFRAFVVEAFVIPTGSMAPTLYGAHGTITCEDCGIEFAYGLRDAAQAAEAQRGGMRVARGNVVHRGGEAVCPSCGFRNTPLPFNDDQGNAESGDRILVLKWPLDTGSAGLGPQRWDVTVFKDPADGTTNFIKRLVGLPDDLLVLMDGDVYVAPARDLPPVVRLESDRIVRDKERLFRSGGGERLRPMSGQAAEAMIQSGLLAIPRKTELAQEVLWSVVHHHDFTPMREEGKYVPRWTPGDARSGWDASRRKVRYEGRQRDGDYIELRGRGIDAACAYNSPHRDASAPPVSDLRVRFVLTPETPTGYVMVRLEKRDRVFWCILQMDGRVQLVESRTEPDVTANLVLVERRVRPFAVGEAVEVSFENVDYRLATHVRGEEVVTSSSRKGDAAYYAPNIRQLLEGDPPPTTSPPRIYASAGTFALEHLVVEKDVYYYSPHWRDSGISGWAPFGTWGSPAYPMLLGTGEFFMLGDNSAASKDSRLWDERGPHLSQRNPPAQLGTVAADQIIGRAFHVYWPAGRPLEWLDWIPPLSRIGVVPDVGRMRWIR